MSVLVPLGYALFRTRNALFPPLLLAVCLAWLPRALTAPVAGLWMILGLRVAAIGLNYIGRRGCHGRITAERCPDAGIRNRREAFENVPVPCRSDENHALLRHCGFASGDSLGRWYNFESLVAVKARTPESS